MDGFAFGMPGAIMLFFFAVFGLIPWVAGIWALITLSRIRSKVETIERLLAGSR